jgi:hypothetical protein
MSLCPSLTPAGDARTQRACVPLALRYRPPQPPLKEGSAVRPQLVCRRQRVAIARGRHIACHSRSAPLTAAAGRGQRRATAPCAPPTARRDRVRQARCVPLALRPISPSAATLQGTARPQLVCRRVRDSIARGRHVACSSRSTLAPPSRATSRGRHAPHVACCRGTPSLLLGRLLAVWLVWWCCHFFV